MMLFSRMVGGVTRLCTKKPRKSAAFTELEATGWELQCETGVFSKTICVTCVRHPVATALGSVLGLKSYRRHVDFF
jgi:hypothetical protein